MLSFDDLHNFIHYIKILNIFIMKKLRLKVFLDDLFIAKCEYDVLKHVNICKYKRI